MDKIHIHIKFVSALLLVEIQFIENKMNLKV